MSRPLPSVSAEDASEFLELVKYAEWRGNLEAVDEPLSWRCFYCYRETSSKGSGRRLIWNDPRDRQGKHLAWLVHCSYCNMPSILDSENRPLFEAVSILQVPNVPDDVDQVFLEALKALSVGCYSSAVLLCRKLIMHLAFDLGTEHFMTVTRDNKGRTPNFVDYVQWLDDNHHIPPQGKKWVEEVVNRGNDENHQLVIASHEEAARIVTITRLLLSYSYEFPQTPEDD